MSQELMKNEQDENLPSQASINTFEDEEKMLREALIEQAETINSIKEDIKQAKIDSNRNVNRHSSSPYIYLYNMYANLTSAQNSKMDIIKTMINLKKLKEELKMKFGKQFEDDTKFQKIANIIFSKITNNFTPEQRLELASGASIDSLSSLDIEEGNDEDQDLDLLAEDAANELNYKTEKDIKEDDFMYVCTTDGLILKVTKDEEMEVLEEIDEEHEDYENFRIVRHKKSGKLISATYLPNQTKLEIVEYE